MKHILLIIVLAMFYNCKAQSPVYSLTDNGYGYNQTSGAYYKDSYNDFDKFIGTWKYTNGNTSLTIILQKR